VTLALGALLHDIGKPDTFERAADRIRFHGHVERGVELADEILRRLRYSNDEIEQVKDLVQNHMRFMHVAEMREGKLKRFLRKPQFDEHLALHRLDCLSSHGDLSSYQFVEGKLAKYSAEQLRPPPLITGRDLIAAGYAPGPQFSEMLSAVEEAQLEGTVRSRDEALEWVEARFGAPAARSPSSGA